MPNMYIYCFQTFEMNEKLPFEAIIFHILNNRIKISFHQFAERAFVYSSNFILVAAHPILNTQIYAVAAYSTFTTTSHSKASNGTHCCIPSFHPVGMSLALNVFPRLKSDEWTKRREL